MPNIIALDKMICSPTGHNRFHGEHSPHRRGFLLSHHCAFGSSDYCRSLAPGPRLMGGGLSRSGVSVRPRGESVLKRLTSQHSPLVVLCNVTVNLEQRRRHYFRWQVSISAPGHPGNLCGHGNERRGFHKIASIAVNVDLAERESTLPSLPMVPNWNSSITPRLLLFPWCQVLAASHYQYITTIRQSNQLN